MTEEQRTNTKERKKILYAAHLSNMPVISANELKATSDRTMYGLQIRDAYNDRSSKLYLTHCMSRDFVQKTFMERGTHIYRK